MLCFDELHDFTYQILSNIKDNKIEDIVHIRVCRGCALTEIQNFEDQKWDLLETYPPEVK